MLYILLITLIVLLVTNWSLSKPLFWKNAGIPYNLPLPIFGSTLPLFIQPFPKAWRNMYAKMGNNSAYGFHFFNKPGLLLGDPNLVKKFTQTDADSFMSRGIHSEESYDPVAKGLAFTKGEQWKVLRAKMTPYFTPSRIKAMLPLIKPTADEFVRYIAENGNIGPVDTHVACIKYTVDVIMGSVFGLEPDSFKNPNSIFYSIQKEMISLHFVLKMLIGFLNQFLYRLLGLTFFSKNSTTILKKLMSDIIDQRINGIGNRPDFAEGMAELIKQEESNNDDEIKYYHDGTNFAKFDRFSVSGQCMLLYFGGTETTGNTISFLLYELAKNQEAQNIARREIIDMLHRTNDNYSYDDLHSLNYVQMAIKETLRMYPVVYTFGRSCTKQADFNGFTIPVGTIIVIAPICLHYDTRYFSEPYTFIPERFLNESSITPEVYVPFGMGPRTCIGMKFAETVILLSICKLLSKYKLTCSNKTQIPIQFANNPTLSPMKGIWLNVQEIK